MSAVSAALAGRAAAEALMLDSCRVTRSGGEPQWSEGDGEYVTPPPVTVYEGRCRLRATTSVDVQEVDAGEREVGVVKRRLSVPVSAETEGIRRGDRVEITASVNAALVGAVFTVSSSFDDSFGTARRIPVEAVT